MKGRKDAIKTARQLLKASFDGGRLNADTVRTIVRHVVAVKPRGFLGILEAYQRMVRLEIEKRHALIECATGLDASLQNQVVRDLRGKYGDDLTMEFRVTPGLIGGMRVRVGSDVWDGSVRGRLNRLAESVS